MIIWRGTGILVFVVIGVAMAIFGALADGLSSGASCILAMFLCIGAGLVFNMATPDRQKYTGSDGVVPSSSDIAHFMFIPFEGWKVIAIIGAVVFLFGAFGS